MRYYEKVQFTMVEEGTLIRESFERLLSLEPGSEQRKIERKALFHRVRTDMLEQGIIDKPYYISLGFVNDKKEIVVVVFDKEVRDEVDYDDYCVLHRDEEACRYYIEDNKEEN